MTKRLVSLRALSTAGLLGLAGVATHAHADTYAGNGNNSFGGAVGGGSLTVNNDGSGGFMLSFTTAGSGNFNGNANDLVIYLDNGQGGGIGDSTAVLTDDADSSRTPVSEYNGTNRSTLTFGGLMSPQYAFDLSSTANPAATTTSGLAGQLNVFSLATTANFGYAGGSALNGASTGGNITYTGVVNANGTATYSLDVPAADLGLTAFSGAALKFAAINISNTGYSSSEATVGLTGNLGYGNTQTLTSVDTFTAAAVPEPGTWAMLAASAFGALAVTGRRRALAN